MRLTSATYTNFQTVQNSSRNIVHEVTYTVHEVTYLPYMTKQINKP